ncbi:dihydrodipicolinate synthase family protein [Tissierella sp. Yu-01]|uniref:dihydrodipicolinate synthase family protein n=1 Tax=Tissierella sp. Yu-01 TaxID=3035694 RepID=UPI00240E3FC7|nr:dihydrodipicolinate synthase family protein [Tissierella sp. Yu-01]WFA08068.1 dihydrodipicolinate synthase family protein [Tissierella sp. Yu-01]
MNTDFIKGIIVPILTPIDENENIDEMKMRQMVNHVIEGGVHGILAFGSNGEFYSIDDDQMEIGLKIMIEEAAGRVPVYMGIGAIKTSKCIKLAQMGVKLGASGVSVLQPMFLKPTEEELYKHFKSIADSVPETPMLLYNNPGRVGYTMSANLVEKLARNVENIIGMKDSSGDMTQTSEFIRRTRDINFKVLGGKDTLIYAAITHGAVGCIATTANMFPELVTSIYNKFIEGDLAGSLEQQYKLHPVRLSMDKASFPVATKDMANLMGLDIGEPFKPNMSSEGNVLEIMKNEMEKAGLLGNVATA